MKPHPRIRKTIKYGGAALTLLLVVVWIGSGWVYLRSPDQTQNLQLTRGQLVVEWKDGVPLAHPCGYAIFIDSFEIRWWFA